MSSTRSLPIPASELEDLVHHAWLDLKQARHDGDATAMLRAERRMNALLDQLTRRT